MDFGRRRGVVTGVILVLIVAAASLIMNLVRSLYSRCESSAFFGKRSNARPFSFPFVRQGKESLLPEKAIALLCAVQKAEESLCIAWL